MTLDHKKGSAVAVGRCQSCGCLHLIVIEQSAVVASIPLTREEWAKLIGAYGDMLAGEEKDDR